MNEKQQQLLFDKGITNVPSDILCSDNTLEESVGMIYDDGEHRVIQKPVEQMSTSTSYHATMYYVHNFGNEKRYIVKRKIERNPYELAWCVRGENNQLQEQGTFDEVDVRNTELLKITSVGKTLIITTDDGMFYYLWKENAYKHLGELPSLQVDFWLKKDTRKDDEDDSQTAKSRSRVYNSHNSDGIILEQGGDDDELQEPPVKDNDAYSDMVVGLFYKNLKAIHSRKGFCLPFCARAALELYDGSYTHITQPVMLFPSITNNSFARYFFNRNNLRLFTYYKMLYFKVLRDYTDWSDIVKNIVVFASEGVNIYDTNVDQSYKNLRVDGPDIEWDGIFREQDEDLSKIHVENERGGGSPYLNYVPLVAEDQSHILSQLKSTSVFYKIFSIGLNDVDDQEKEAVDYIGKYTLENLVTQESLEYDDYFSRSKLYPRFEYPYNSRLNLANVERGFFEGFDFFIDWDNDDEHSYSAYVKIATDTKDVWIEHKYTTNRKQGVYFFYPDSRAKHVTIYRSDQCILNAELEEHTSLNGAFFLSGLPGDKDEGDAAEASLIDFHPNNDQNDNNEKELLPNYIITSEVNNPWVFKAEGYNKVGTGKIIGMSTTTMALSNDSYGRNDLVVFSESGLWGMSVDGTGLYQSIHPFSREVCNNPDSITPVDGAAFFSSEKGLMMVTDKGVSCVSEQLSGREHNFSGEIDMGNFHDYLKYCFIAYDYRDSLLWIFNNDRDYCWVYSIKSGVFGKYKQLCSYVINDYPDTLLSSGMVFYSFIDRPNINDDTTDYTGLMISRPMKFENGLALKSLMDVRNLRQMQGSLTLRVFASNNLNSWVELNSLRGTPWKYFRFRFDFSNMKATDRFSGSVIVTQERRTDKIR